MKDNDDVVNTPTNPTLTDPNATIPVSGSEGNHNPTGNGTSYAAVSGNHNPGGNGELSAVDDNHNPRGNGGRPSTIAPPTVSIDELLAPYEKKKQQEIAKSNRDKGSDTKRRGRKGGGGRKSRGGRKDGGGTKRRGGRKGGGGTKRRGGKDGNNNKHNKSGKRKKRGKKRRSKEMYTPELYYDVKFARESIDYEDNFRVCKRRKKANDEVCCCIFFLSQIYYEYHFFLSSENFLSPVHV